MLRSRRAPTWSASSSPRRARVERKRCSTRPRPCCASPSSSASARRRRPTSCSSTRATTATGRVTPSCCAATSASARSSTCRGRRTTRRTSTVPARPRGASCSPAGSAPGTSPRRSPPFAVGGRFGALDGAAPGVKDHDLRARAGRSAARMTRLFGDYGGRYVPETLIPALDELEAGWAPRRPTTAFRAELARRCARTTPGRPTPLTRAERFAPGPARLPEARGPDAHRVRTS